MENAIVALKRRARVARVFVCISIRSVVEMVQRTLKSDEPRFDLSPLAGLDFSICMPRQAPSLDKGGSRAAKTSQSTDIQFLLIDGICGAR